MKKALGWPGQIAAFVLGFALTLVLASCTREVIVDRVVTVKVPVVQPCIEQAPDRPVYKTGQGEYPEGKEAARRLAEDFEAAERYGNEWEAAAAGCLVVPPPAPGN